MSPARETIPEAKPLRLFVAADVPDDVKSELETGVTQYRHRIPGARWTQQSGWHVTLKFLGRTWPRMLDPLGEAMADAAGSGGPFDSALTELGAFPSARRARVVWAGLSDPDGRFAAIAARLDEVLAEDFAAEERAFTPHLTLARLNPTRDISEFAPDLVGAPVPSRPFAVDSLVLYRSHPGPGGASYEALSRVVLSG